MYESHGFPTPKQQIEDEFGRMCYGFCTRLARREKLTDQELASIELCSYEADYGSYLCWVACYQFLAESKENRETAFQLLKNAVEYFDTLPNHG